MSSVKGCKRCKYDKTIYNIDYEKSAQEQQIYYTTDKVCSKCNYNPESKRKYIYDKEYYVIPLDKVTDDMNVDLSKIVHEHNHNKFSHIVDKVERDDKNVCIKLTLIKHYKCDICDKIVDYTEIEEFKEYKDIYDITKYKINYKASAKEQKICYSETKICSKSKHVFPKKYYKEVSLDNYPSDMNVDLSKIIHEHNHNKIDYKEDKIEYDNENNCIKLVLIKYYKCDICNKKINEYTEIEEYDLNNPCERMNELTKERKEGKKYNYDIYDHDYDNDYESGASYDRKGGHYYTYHGEWISGY